MIMKNKALLLFSHLFVLIVGFGLGVYFLPILTAPKSLDTLKINEYEQKALYQTEFVKDLKGSDLFHWGEAKVTISKDKITVNGSIAPGPDYKLYLTNEFVEHEDEFLAIKDQAKYVAEVKSFNNFAIDVSNDIQVNKYNTIVIWCESFNEFITSAKYQ
ncbi:electron transfer DM13 [Candidatus Pelagibacter ubique HIMB4]